jgi:DNA-binding transcriptional LysR family regulator
MVLKQLAYLVALAREQHFGRAAATAHITQPTLSAAIRALEDELGLPVVERGHRFNGFTPQGLVVLEHAKRILAECSAMRQSLDEFGRGLSGRLRLGAVPTALPVVSHLTSPFYARYPRVTVTVLSLTSDQIVRGIENFDLEAGITYLDNEPLPPVRAKPIYSEEYAFLTHEASPYAALGSITWTEAAEAPLCLLTPDMQNRRIIDGIFRSVGKSPTPAVETNSIFNLCSHTASGHWSSIVPRPLLRFFGMPKGTVALPLVEPEASRSMGLIIADREPASPLARALWFRPPNWRIDRKHLSIVSIYQFDVEKRTSHSPARILAGGKCRP